MENKYLTLEQAAMLVNPKYKTRSIYPSMLRHVKEGHFGAYYPQMALLDEDGKVQQVIGASPNPFFKLEELNSYLEKQKPLNLAKGHQRAVNVDGKEFATIAAAAEAIGVEYHQFYSALKSTKEIKGHKVNLV